MASKPTPRAWSFAEACALLGELVDAGFRGAVVADVASARTLGHGLRRLRDALRANAFSALGRRVDLDDLIQSFERRSRPEGFHALHDWEGRAERFNDDTIPVEVLNFIIAQRGHGPADPVVAAILLDYYILYVLALCALRVWDDGHVNDNLDRLADLLGRLQGPGGSGQQFVAGAEALVLVATSHYEPDDHGYDQLLRKMGTLDATHQARMALVHASCMGGHLRFGFEATYGRDVALMREDNVVDYPWLLWALAAVMREFDRLRAEGVDGLPHDRLVEGLLNGLSPDANAILTNPPAFLAPMEDDRLQFCESFARHRHALVPAFRRMRPTDSDYSPLSFFFNFSQNVLKGTVVDALLWGEAWGVSFDELLTGLPPGAPRNQARTRLATTLMGYARASPDIIRGRRMPVIVYDPQAGRRAHAITMREVEGRT
jgi:hypothetical protein